MNLSEIAVSAILIVAIGLIWILFPRAIFKLRNTPGINKETELNESGVIFYRIIVMLIIVVGLFLIYFEYF
ncbi:hypothetical protein [Haladaptatus cibarius]|uniref:hypothetical protein n=1 Tax=Haladaptatus cibarius TaxID=453847 RepID=UPI000678F440|nr:hypothetical protein [Haladaptatus cibarius]